MSVINRLGKLAGAGAAVREVIAKTKIKGKLLRERDKPAEFHFAGIEVFKRDENLNRTWFWGLIKRGKSQYAKDALAAKAARERAR